MPDFPIVDTHLHIWDPAVLHYPWLSEVPKIAERHGMEEYRAATAKISVEKLVFLQCECEPAQYLQELRWVNETADKVDGRIAGIVPWAPLEKGDDARAELDAIAQFGRVRGIRRIIQFEPDITFCLQPGFIRGVQLLAEYDFHFEICIRHHQLPNTIKLVKQCPNVRCILDHIAKPDIKAKMLDPWRKDLKELAGFKNVWCKMSGLVTEADNGRWTREDLKPYIDHVIATFGFDRLMFGGDWPVVVLASSYQRWIDALDWALAGRSQAQQRKLYHDNAIAFYRLDKKK